MTADLRPLLRPRRVAVVGASDREGRPNTAIWRRMAAWGEEVGAEVIPVNPRADELDGRRCARSLSEAASWGSEGPGQGERDVRLAPDVADDRPTPGSGDVRLVGGGGTGIGGDDGTGGDAGLDGAAGIGAGDGDGDGDAAEAGGRDGRGQPGALDLVVVLVADPVPVVAEAAAVGARFAVVFASGFAELGAAGQERQDELLAAAAGSGLRILGPNTNLNAFESFRTDLGGPAVALLTQSGHQGRPLFMSQELGVRLAGWLPTGNEADLEVADGIEWFADQPDVGAIAAYVEGFRDGDHLRRALDHAVARRTPVVVVKVGRSDRGAAAARSHTGKLAGSDRVVDAVLAQHGAVRVDDLDELIDTAQLLARCPRPPKVPGGGAVVYSISGGTGAHAVDLLAGAGVGLAELSEELQGELHEMIPPDLGVGNPVDSGGHPVGDERGRRILEALVRSPEVGVLVVPVTGPFPPLSDVLARDLVEVAETTDTPICVVWGSPLGDEPAFREVLASSSRLVLHRRVSNCARALRAWVDWHDHLARVDDARDAGGAPVASAEGSVPYEPVASEPIAPGEPGVPDALSVLRPGWRSDEHQAMQLVAAFGVPVADERVARSAAEAVAAWRALGHDGHGGRPVVMKALSSELAHKSEVGGVRLGVTGEVSVVEAYDDLARLSGGPVLVGEQVEGGVEVVVGVQRDEVFGPVVVVGAGGVLAEVLDDVALAVPPFDRATVRRALRGLRMWPVLDGARGSEPADTEALVEVVMAVQRLALAAGDRLGELDLNPVLVRRAGGGAVALDALVIGAEGPPLG